MVAFQGMHVLPAKHSEVGLQTDTWTGRQTPYKAK